MVLAITRHPIIFLKDLFHLEPHILPRTCPLSVLECLDEDGGVWAERGGAGQGGAGLCLLGITCGHCY